MALLERIKKDNQAAMLAKDKNKQDALKNVITSLTALSKQEDAVEITPSIETALLQKMVKSRRDVAEIYVQQNRKDLADIELYQASIIEQYLPKQLSESGINTVIDHILLTIPNPTIKDMGNIMNQAKLVMSGTADSSIIAKVIKEKLNK